MNTRPGIVRERASNARGRFYTKERVRKRGFLMWVLKAVDLSTEYEFIHTWGIAITLLNESTVAE